MKTLATPHYFTLFRILIAPLFPIIYYEHALLGISFSVMPYLLLLLLLIGECSDLFDGFIARKNNQVTDLGKILDPMADSIMRITVFFTFTGGLVQIPLVLAFIFLYRDFFMSALRTICALKGFALAARKSGKVKAVLQAASAFGIIFLILFNSNSHNLFNPFNISGIKNFFHRISMSNL